MLAAVFALGSPAWAAKEAKVKVCHLPPGDPGNFHTITISANALPGHLGHGDLAGECSAHCAQLCDDGNACTVDACDSTGHCAATHPPVSCDDGSLCTTDTCDPATGCSSAPRTCSDSNLCTVDSCDPLTGNCVFPPTACSPGQSCNPASGDCESNDVDECLSLPCVHGDCVDGENQYTCQCLPGFSGVNCDNEIDECESNPCVHGDCIDQVNRFQCSCLPGWTGTLCDQPQQQTYNCTDRNPCTPENAANGLFYFAADDPAHFIQCSEFGSCFDMACPAGLVWNQGLLTCTSG